MYVYNEKRAILPRQLADNEVAHLGAKYYKVFEIELLPSGVHVHKKTMYLSSESFLLLKLGHGELISYSDLKKKFT
jgi:hypothetical protein